MVPALLQETAGNAQVLVLYIHVGNDALGLLFDLTTRELLLEGLHLLFAFLQLAEQFTHVFDASFLKLT